MYRVYVKYEGTEYPIYEPLDEEMRIFDPVFSEEIGCAGTFVFKIYSRHPNYDKIKPCRSEIILYRDQEALFYGRAMKPEQGFDNLVSITCEGELTYLLDSMQSPFAFTGSLRNYIVKLIEVHNTQVDPEKRIEIGNIIVTGGTDTTERELTGFSPTLTVLRQLVTLYGGYLRIRHDGGKRYLDYLWDYGGINLEAIRFGENLLDLSKYVDASKVITCLIPQGGTVEYQDELGETQTRTIDITSVNGGKNYIKDTEAVKRYGRIWGHQVFEEATDPAALLKKAEAYLEEAAALPETIEIHAIDMSLIDANISQFHLGCWTTVSSAPHGIEKQYMMSQREIHLLDPSQGSITLGQTVPTFTGTYNRSQAAISERVNKIVADTVEEINRKVENATQLITGGFGGYVVLDNIDPVTGKKMHPWRILVMNTPDKETAKNIIQINQNGIGFSTTGMHGPYRNAWTIDGNLVADFITTGTMYADRIRGGTLELGGTGTGRDGKIIVKDTDGAVIGQFDKNGIIIKGGKLELGGVKDGNIVVKDADGNVIGAWDKTGLSILKGILQGVSAIFGGIDNENGAIEVRDASGRLIGRWDKDGLFIIRGNITVGPFEATEDGVLFGDWEVSADGSNILQSQDGSVVIQTRGGSGPTADHPLITLTSADGIAEMSSYHLKAKNIFADSVLTSPKIVLHGTDYWDGNGYDGDIKTILDIIWTGKTWSLERLRDDLNELEDRVSSLENI